MKFNSFYAIFFILIIPSFSDAQVVKWHYAEKTPLSPLLMEMVETVLTHLDIEVIHEEFPWKRAQYNLKAGNCDGIITGAMPFRFEYAVFCKELAVPLYLNLFYKKGNSKIESLLPSLYRFEQLKSLRMLTYIGNGWAPKYAEQGWDIYFSSHYTQLPIQLYGNRGDYIIMLTKPFRYFTKQYGLTNSIGEVSVDWEFTKLSFFFLISRVSPWAKKGLPRAMDETLKKMKASGEWLKILKKYDNPHGNGKPFIDYGHKKRAESHGYYKDYHKLPIYIPD